MCKYGTYASVTIKHKGRDVTMSTIDSCIAPIVQALNNAGIITMASCCGHENINGWIPLADGREILIAKNREEARLMESVFKVDIHGAPFERNLEDAEFGKTDIIPEDEPIHEFFGLSYANYLVLRRTVLQSMPPDWQKKLVDLLNEMEHRFKGFCDGNYLVRLRESKGKFIHDELSDYQRGRRKIPPFVNCHCAECEGGKR